jgi:hypothetical protein
VRSWRNWQTHQLEGLAVAIPWWFESTRPHHLFLERWNFAQNSVFPNKHAVSEGTAGNGWESQGARNQPHRQHIVNTVLTGRPEGTSGILRDNL